MNKSDLKTGMIVVDREGNRKKVLLNTKHGDILVYPNHDCFGYLEDYNDDLSNKDINGLNIVSVYNSIFPESQTSFDIKYYDLIWEKNECLEMSIEDIEVRLGHEIKIIK